MSDNWRAILTRPFEPHEIDWKPLLKPEKAHNNRLLFAPYIDARAAMDRLDEAVGPENWQDEYVPGPSGGVLCRLSLRIGGEWITKEDVGVDTGGYNPEKGAVSDALKRTLAKWGARNLYDLDPEWFPFEERGRAVIAKPTGKWARTEAPKSPQTQTATGSNGATHMTKQDAARVAEWWRAQGRTKNKRGLSDEAALHTLGIDRLGEFEGSADEAIAELDKRLALLEKESGNNRFQVVGALNILEGEGKLTTGNVIAAYMAREADKALEAEQQEMIGLDAREMRTSQYDENA